VSISLSIFLFLFYSLVSCNNVTSRKK
jgi:hypothetical protein